MAFNNNRRTFIKNSALISSGMLLSASPFTACKPGNNNAPFGLQLYTLRDDLPKDPQGVIKKVASFGYKQIEGYEGDKGIYWGMKNTEFKKFISDLGLDMVSSHCAWDKELDRKAAEAAEIGMKYLLCPNLGSQPGIDSFKRFAAQFNEAGKICKKHGIRFAYHNHAYSFVPVDGQLPQDVLMTETDPALVDFEMDIYWVITAGQDPETFFKKYPDRFRLGHVKDRIKNADPNDAESSCTLGTGSIDYNKIVKDAKDAGMQYFIVEQERYDNTTPLQAAEADAVYMKKLPI